MAVSRAEVGKRTKVGRKKGKKSPGGLRRWAALSFLLPAALILGALVVYPFMDTVFQSFQHDQTRNFVGTANYERALSSDRVLTALKNNAIWVAVAPALITGLGLIFAVLTERVSYGTALKVVLFMPMAISFLSTGVIWRIMYEQDPNRGLVNAVIGAGYNTVSGAGNYTGARVSGNQPALEQDAAGTVSSSQELGPGDTQAIGLTAINPDQVPDDAEQAVEPQAAGNEIGVTVWRDFKPGGGEPGVIEEDELGLPGVTVELVDDSGNAAASETTAENGTVVFEDPGDGPFTARLPESNFQEGFAGFAWLQPGLVTPALIGAFLWASVGFSVVIIAAGLAALPRDLLEAARVDGANEWQVFRRITVPLMKPVLTVVFITMTINVLKIFDIVYVTAPGNSQQAANVLALDMWRTSFSARRYGEGAAIAVLLFVLVVPILYLNLKRFRRED